jgi:hypothetical protein
MKMLLCACLLLLGCDALPKFQVQLQADIQNHYQVKNALVMVMDTTTMLVMVFDDAHAALEQKALAAFEEDVASYAATHYRRSRLLGVAVAVNRATRSSATRRAQPTFFVPEYHPDGTVRMALLPENDLARPARAVPARPPAPPLPLH